MNFVSLADYPELFPQTLELINQCFQYKKPHKFEVDFYPLINKSNHENSFIVLDDQNKPMAHIAVKARNLALKGEFFPCLLIGGICVSPENRGKGLFNSMLRKVLSSYSHFALAVLWSGDYDMYKKHDFYPCIEQFELPQGALKNNEFSLTKFSKLSSDEKKSLVNLSKKRDLDLLTFERSKDHWSEIEKIESADLYIKKTGQQISSFFFMNKGMDLDNIIYDFFAKDQIDFEAIRHYGKLWTPYNELFDPDETNVQLHFAALVRIHNLELFNTLLSRYYQDESFDIEIQSIENDHLNFVISIKNESASNKVKINDFLEGIWGPSFFEELQGLKSIPFYISGLDSV